MKSNGKPYTVEEQELIIYVARYHTNRTTALDKIQSLITDAKYSLDDIDDFKTILSDDLTHQDAVEFYWDLDTLAREQFIEILFSAYSPEY